MWPLVNWSIIGSDVPTELGVVNFGVKQGGRSCANGVRLKVWTRTKILSPSIRYFVAILRFVAIYTFYKAFIEL